MPTDKYPVISGGGYIWCPTLLYPAATGLAAQGQYSATANKVYGMYMHIPFTVTLTKASYFIASGTAVAGSHFGCGLYDMNGNRIISATLSGATGAPTAPSATIDQTSVILAGGSYYYCWSADNTTINLSLLSVLNFTLLRDSVKSPYAFQAANASASGVMPSTLGALSDITGGFFSFPPITLFHN